MAIARWGVVRGARRRCRSRRNSSVPHTMNGNGTTSRSWPADSAAVPNSGCRNGVYTSVRANTISAAMPTSTGRLQRDLKDPVRPLRAGQPSAHVHQHGMHETRIIEVQATGGVFPARVEREALHRLPIRKPLDALQHHHHRHDHRRHAAPAHIGEQIGEHLIREQVEALPVQHAVNRVRRDPALAEVHRRAPQIRLLRRQTQTHPTILAESNRLPGQRHAKNTSVVGGL